MKGPNFFIVGAPKCGTTALNDYLSSHPDIFMAQKELHYFANDIPKSAIRPVDSLKEYLAYFQKAYPSHKAVGESSVMYLYSPVALKNIFEYDENAKIIVMLRNPVEMVYSLHSQYRYAKYEDEKDLEKVWDKLSSRRKGFDVPVKCPTPEFLQYDDIGKYSVQMERLLAIFPREQVKVIIFDDFVSAIKETYEDVLQFLDVPSDGKNDFPIINENKVNKNEFVASIVKRPPGWIVNLSKRIKEIVGLESLGIWKVASYIHRLNEKKVSRTPMPPEFRIKLIEEFRRDISRLSDIVDRDLSHWNK